MDSISLRPSRLEEPSRLRKDTAPPVGDDLDDLFNYDAGIDDVFRDVDTNMDATLHSEPGRGKDKHNTAVGLGIKEEIKVSRKRQPVAKLDEARYDRWRNARSDGQCLTSTTESSLKLASRNCDG